MAAVAPLRATALPDAPAAVWVAHQRGVLKLAATDGRVLATVAGLEDVQALALDASRQTVWVATKRALVACDFNGVRQLTVPLLRTLGDKAGIAVREADGSVWVGEGKDLWSFSASGLLLAQIRLGRNLMGLALDPADDLLWVGDDKTVEAREPVSGALLRSFNVSGDGKLEALTLDPLGLLWLGLKDELRRVDEFGATQVRYTFHNLRALSASPQGVWAASEKELRLYGESGLLTTLSRPLQGDGGIRLLAADPARSSVWIASQRQLAEVSSVDPTVRALALQGSISIVALAVYADALPPDLVILAPVEGATLSDPHPVIRVRLQDTGSGVDTATLAARIDGLPAPLSCQVVSAATMACTPVSPLGEGLHQVELTIADRAGNRSAPASVRFTVDTIPQDPDLPPDPATIAPDLDRTIATDLFAATRFLYTGLDPVQTGVAAGAIDPVRVAVLRGRILEREGSVLPGARISILGRPELGGTLSRADGWFDLAVNGGEPLILQVEKPGHLTAQRAVTAAWRDYSPIEDIVLVPLDPRATPIISGSTALQVARGRLVEDEDGRRQATLLFPAGTEAVRVLADGSTEPLPTFTFRVTEYTVGASGPRAMPGPLPPNVGYTYAVELSADEVGDDAEVSFSTPAVLYVENFIGFPVGSPVPAGSYRRREGRWLEESNGRVIRLLGTDSAGQPRLDLDGSGLAAEEAQLAELGITAAELESLPSLYSAGTSLWRVAVPHFSPWDLNWPFAPPPDAVPPPPDPDEGQDPNDPNDSNDSSDPRDHRDPADPSDPNNPNDPRAQDPSQDEDRPDTECGSILDCHNQILGEAVPLAGTSETLHYASDRVPGRNANYFLKVQLTGATVPVGLRRVDLEIALAGQVIRRSYPPQPKQVFTYLWDGLDAYGRPVQGKQPVTIRKAFVYPLVYYRPLDAVSAWARFGVSPFDTEFRRGLGEFTIWRTRQGPIDGLARVIGGWDARELGLGGWSLSSHHVFDPNGRALYLGTGERRTARQVGPVALVAAGTGEHGYSGDGGRAVRARLAIPGDVAVAPDGTAYIADTGNHVVRKVSPSGTISRVAGVPGELCMTPSGGSTTGPPCGTGGPALAAHLYEPGGVAVGPDGTLYIADTRDNCVRRLVGGRLETVAGQCAGLDPDGGGQFAQTTTLRRKDLSDCLAGCNARTELDLREPADIAVAADGALYIADTRNNRLVQVSPSGRAWIVAGLGPAGGDPGDGGQALEASFLFPLGIALGTDGEIYVSDAGNHRVRRIGRDGIIQTVAGTGVAGFSGDGGPGAEAQISVPARLAVGRDGSLFFVDSGNYRVRRVGASGIVSTLAGGEDQLAVGGSTFAGALAQGVRFLSPIGLAAAPDGSLWVTDLAQVYRVGTALRGFTGEEIVIPSDSGASLYVFDRAGRHQRTISSTTRAVLASFRYDGQGRLTEVEDLEGLVTRIEHGAAGGPVAIVAPFGQRTALALDGRGFLATITNPSSETVTLASGGGGLLESMTDPRGNATRFTYDTLGRLRGEEDPAGGAKSFVRYQTFDDFRVDEATAEGRITSRSVENFASRASSRATFDSRFGASRVDSFPNGQTRITAPDGSATTQTLSGDPLWGALAPYPSARATFTPSGLVSRTTVAQDVDLADFEDPLSLRSRHATIMVNGRFYQSGYDAATRRLDGATPEGRRGYTLRDPAGRVVEVGRSGLASLRILYDGSGRPRTAAQGAGAEERVSTFEYDPSGWLARVIDPAGRAMSFTRDGTGRVLRQELPDGRAIHFGYDASGNVSTVTPPGRSPHGFSFTPFDLPAAYAPPPLAGLAQPATTYTYDRDRRMTSIVRPDGRQVALAWAASGQLGGLDFSLGRIAYTYSPQALSQVTRISAPGGVDLALDYDGFLPVRSTWSGPVSGIVERVYDNDFRISTLRIAGVGFLYRYDGDGLPIQAGDLAIQRDAETGLPTGTTLGEVSTSATYNAFGEPLEMSASLAGAGLYTTAFERDKLGRITREVETLGAATATLDYTYDPAGRLIEVVKDGLPISTLTYDANSNRTSRVTPQEATTASYDDQDRLLTHGDTTYQYTANGELRSKTQNNQTVTYDYDELGHLRHVVLADGIEIDYLIDGQNRRIGKRINGTQVQGFLYQSALAPAAEIDSTGAVISRFVYGTRLNVPDYLVRNGRAYRIVADHLGSPRLLIDSTDGTVAQRLDYDEWGRVTLDTNPGFQPFGFAGGLYDRQTGLVRFGARDYDPEVGRWMAKDPIGFLGGDANLYGYVLQDPINSLDPEGLAGKCPQVPLAPPGVNIDRNLTEARKHTFPFDLLWFYKQVDYGGPWDYKSRGDEYEPFGNFHFGAVGLAAGIPENLLLREAGRAQVDNNRPDGKGDPGWRLNPWGGTPPYGDDPRDQEWIKKGFEYCKCREEP